MPYMEGYTEVEAPSLRSAQDRMDAATETVKAAKERLALLHDQVKEAESVLAAGLMEVSSAQDDFDKAVTRIRNSAIPGTSWNRQADRKIIL